VQEIRLNKNSRKLIFDQYGYQTINLMRKQFQCGITKTARKFFLEYFTHQKKKIAIIIISKKSNL